MNVTVMLIVFGVLGTTAKRLLSGSLRWKSEKELRPSKLLHFFDQPEHRKDFWLGLVWFGLVWFLCLMAYQLFFRLFNAKAILLEEQ